MRLRCGGRLVDDPTRFVDDPEWFIGYESLFVGDRSSLVGEQRVGVGEKARSIGNPPAIAADLVGLVDDEARWLGHLARFIRDR